MQNISPALKAEIMKGTFCSLVRISTELGAVYGYTDYPTPLTYSGTVYEPSPSLARLRNYQTTSTSSNSQKVELVRVGEFTDEELMSGLFDSAVVTVMRVVPTRLDLGHYLINEEAISATKWSENTLSFDILDFFRGLNGTIGTQNSPYCRHTFGDQFSESKKGACTLNVASYTYNLTVTSVVKQRMQFTVSSALPSGRLANGNFTWTLGHNAGGKDTIKSDTAVGGVHTITLFIPSTFVITVGDTLTVVVGCDGTFETCNATFNNGRNFGGNPLLNPGVTLR